MNSQKDWKIFLYNDIHSHIPGSGRVMSIDFAKPFTIPPLQSVTIGVHPWSAGEVIDWDRFESFLKDERVVGVGEAGLDALRGPGMSIQMPIFERQIELAERYSLPLIIHSVRSNHRILQLMKKYSPDVPWIIHGFRGNDVEAKNLIDAGLHLSLGDKSRIDTSILPSEFVHWESDEEQVQ